MSKPAAAVSLGEVPPARSRQQGRRSAVTVADDVAVVGTADGDLLGVDIDTDGQPVRAWEYECDDDASVVAAMPFDDGVVVGERSARGAIRYHAPDGTLRWQYRARQDLGPPQDNTRFLLPFVASLATDGDSLYAAARRYERGQSGDETSRTFESVVYAFDSDGAVRWTYRTDASPISLSVRGDRLAVAYNRCVSDHQDGLVVLDTDEGEPRWRWDPGTPGQRRVGDVALLEAGALVTSHGDYAGYRVAEMGAKRWRVPVGTRREVDGETVYAYPNHVHATDSAAVFVTGNTYPEDGRETATRHPNEHTAVGVSLDGGERWSAPVGGFASGLGGDGDLLAVPGAQHFRDRDPDAHAVRVFDVVDGRIASFGTEGIVTAAGVSGDTVVAVEEPVVYHDEGRERGSYRVHRFHTGQ